MHRAMPSARGFSLIEVLVTLVIIAGGLLVLGKFQTELVGANSQAIQRSEATMLAQQQIEAMRSYRNLTEYAAISSGSDTVAGTSTTYNRAWTVVTNTTAPLYKTFNITVSWTDNRNVAQSVSLASNIVSNDPKLSGDLIYYTTSSTSTTSTTTTTAATTTTTASGTTTTTSAPTTTADTTTTTTTTLVSCPSKTINFTSHNGETSSSNKILSLSHSSCSATTRASNGGSGTCTTVAGHAGFTISDGNGHTTDIPACSAITSGQTFAF